MVDFLDPELLAALDGLQGRPFSGHVWRVTWATRNPLAGSSGGGRWSPEGRLEALYTSLEQNGALAEAYHHLSRAPVMSSSHMLLNKLSVSVEDVLELSVDQLVALGMERSAGIASDEQVGTAHRGGGIHAGLSRTTRTERTMGLLKPGGFSRPGIVRHQKALGIRTSKRRELASVERVYERRLIVRTRVPAITLVVHNASTRDFTPGHSAFPKFRKCATLCALSSSAGAPKCRSR